MRRTFLVRWMVIGVIGTVVGLGAAGFVGLMGLATDSFSAAVSAGVVFGASIGVSIGLAQGLVLSGRLEAISASRWATFTAAGAALAWAAVAYPIGQLVIEGTDPSWATRLLWATAIGLAAGGIVGLLQWFELRRAVPASSITIAAQAGGWMIGALILATADGLIGDSIEEFSAIVIAAAALGLAGAIVSVVQGHVLDRALPEAEEAPQRELVHAR